MSFFRSGKKKNIGKPDQSKEQNESSNPSPVPPIPVRQVITSQIENSSMGSSQSFSGSIPSAKGGYGVFSKKEVVNRAQIDRIMKQHQEEQKSKKPQIQLGLTKKQPQEKQIQPKKTEEKAQQQKKPLNIGSLSGLLKTPASKEKPQVKPVQKQPIPNNTLNFLANLTAGKPSNSDRQKEPSSQEEQFQEKKSGQSQEEKIPEKPKISFFSSLLQPKTIQQKQDKQDQQDSQGSQKETKKPMFNLGNILSGMIAPRKAEQNKEDHSQDANIQKKKARAQKNQIQSATFNIFSLLGTALGNPEPQVTQQQKDEIERKVRIHTRISAVVRQACQKIRVLIEKYRKVDQKVYNKLMKNKVKGKHLTRFLPDQYFKNNNFIQKVIIFVLNSYDQNGICRLFTSFALEFDTSNDRKFQLQELEECLHFLSREEYLGRQKVLQAVKDIGIKPSTALSFFQQGAAAKRLLTNAQMKQVFRLLKYQKNFSSFSSMTPSKRDSQLQAQQNLGLSRQHHKKIEESEEEKEKQEEFIDFNLFAPYLVSFFFQYQQYIFLKRRAEFRQLLGFPYKVEFDGQEIFDTKGSPSGIFRVFVNLLKGETDIKKEILTYRIVNSALINYRSIGVSKTVSMEALERILRKVRRDIMKVDEFTGREERQQSMETFLPWVAAEIATESSVESSNIQTGSKQNDMKVHWLGGALAYRLTDDYIKKQLKQYLTNDSPTGPELITALGNITKKIISNFDQIAWFYVTNKLAESPNNLISKSPLKFKLDYIIENQNLLERLYQFSMQFLLQKFVANLLFQKDIQIYKECSGWNKLLSDYNISQLGKGLMSNAFNFKNFLIQNNKGADLQKVEQEKVKHKQRRLFQQLIDTDPREPTKSKARAFKAIDVYNQQKISSAKQLQIVLTQEERIKMQAKANEIDRIVQTKERKKQKTKAKMKKSNALANNTDITPDMMMPILEIMPHNHDKEIKSMKKYIQDYGQLTSYPQIMRFMNQNKLKKFKKKNQQKKQFVCDKVMQQQIHYLDQDYFINEIHSKQNKQSILDDPLPLIPQKSLTKPKVKAKRQEKVKQLYGNLYNQKKISQMRIKPTALDADLKFEPTQKLNREKFERQNAQKTYKTEEKPSRDCCMTF